MEEVKVFGEGGKGIRDFHEESADRAAEGVGEWAGELLEAGLAGGVAASEDAGDG